ncbi:MAG: carboxypeptidase-like regulatory domain-containing protein [Acidipropionibacterium sp.]|nr:carboxypeptidase-like regulatory domain-containing protein [Acidipropionibacterium sp.]
MTWRTVVGVAVLGAVGILGRVWGGSVSGSGRELVRRLVAAAAAALIGATTALAAVTQNAADAAPSPSAHASTARSGASTRPDPSGAAASALPAARLTASMAPAQGAPTSIIRITGTLTDSRGGPVDGASIAIQGSFDDVPRAFSATDRLGAFTAAIQVPPGTLPGAVTIRASLVGDTRFRPVSQTWRYTVVGPAGSPVPSAQNSGDSPGPSGSTPAGSGPVSPGALGSGTSGTAQQQDSADQSGLPQLPGSASPLAAGQQQNSPGPPGLVAALGGRTAVMAFLIVLGSLLALALIGWVIRGIARWIRRRRDGGLSDTGPRDGANDLFD